MTKSAYKHLHLSFTESVENPSVPANGSRYPYQQIKMNNISKLTSASVHINSFNIKPVQYLFPFAFGGGVEVSDVVFAR